MAIVDQKLSEQYELIHKSKHYEAADEFRPHLQIAVAELRPSSILNYGCGQTNLHNELNLFGAQYFRYDPGIPELSELPVQRVDFLINTDVLEHVPEENLDDVIGHLASISENALINISTRPASEVLRDGSNAHCTIKSPQEWLVILKRHFPRVELTSVRERHSCLFLTWPSSMAEAMTLLNQVPGLRKNLARSNRTLFEGMKKEIGRLKRRLSRA